MLTCLWATLLLSSLCPNVWLKPENVWSHKTLRGVEPCLAFAHLITLPDEKSHFKIRE